ncbi:MAG: hypothetical protein M2R45_03190 [Verrucomicrobia subdivision 3 bacterium]|nr:hypothetical protein [Limisphaerales bacterium]MCS1413905.1 hypothetical protein [Limisphaerales bacterium]
MIYRRELGIGLAIALRDGAKIAVGAKTVMLHLELSATIHTAVEAINNAGGEGLGCSTDIHSEEVVANAFEQTVSCLDAIDILVSNASAGPSHRHGGDADEALRLHA